MYINNINDINNIILFYFILFYFFLLYFISLFQFYLNYLKKKKKKKKKNSNAECNRFASSSKDGTVKIWDAKTRRVLMTFGSHTAPVMCVKWGGEGLIYSASRDKTIKVWDSKDVSIL